MSARFFAYLDALRAAYWFIPTVMSLLAIALSFFTTSIDAVVGPEWLENVSWVYANKPAGARTVLSTIAGSMITVAGVVFSITIASVSYAAAQYGPRLLSNFMRDRGSQFTLGTFIATFLYCLLVIRTVRGADETPLGGGTNSESVAAEFVPNIAILTGIGLALCSIAVLIYFVHHVARSIHISHVIADIGMELRRKIVERFPLERATQTAKDLAETTVEEEIVARYRNPDIDDTSDDCSAVAARTFGFVQAIDRETLIKIACEHDLMIKLLSQPGKFVQNNSRVLQVWPRENVTDEIADTLRHTFITGETRTPVQDLMFLVDELVEIAARALSPGVNDPFTAMNCLDWLGAAVGDLGSRHMPEPYWRDVEGRVRVIVPEETFAMFSTEAFGQLRPYAAGDVNASLHMLDTIAEVSVPNDYKTEREALRQEVLLLTEACVDDLNDIDMKRVKERSAEVLRQIAQPAISHVV